MDINRKAPVVARHEIAIRAPIESVWELLTAIEGWPDWNPDIVAARASGPIAEGTLFQWETGGIAIASTLHEVVPLRKLAWSCTTAGILGVRVWALWSYRDGTQVCTEESWEGSSLPAPALELQAALDTTLTRWLTFLKTRAEAASAARHRHDDARD